MKILHLPLKSKWFNMIESGEKTEEYREIKPYWAKRIMDHYIPDCEINCNCHSCNMRLNGLCTPRSFEFVTLKAGYSKDSPELSFVPESISTGIGNPEWGAPDYPVFIIRIP